MCRTCPIHFNNKIVVCVGKERRINCGAAPDVTIITLAQLGAAGLLFSEAFPSKITICRYFQHSHFIPIVGVGKRGEY